ncbi:ABC transporter substrate-binding protein [Candidatus Latescibacterota bacterium]
MTSPWKPAPWAAVAVAAFLLGGPSQIRAETVMVDDLGDTTTLASVPQRIVSLAPSNTEILFALGLGDRIVGVTDYCNYPPAAADIEKVAGFSTLSVEKIAAAEPDLVVASRGNDIEGIRSLRQLQVPIFALSLQSVDQLLGGIERLGALCDRDSAATALSRSLRVVAAGEYPRVMWASLQEPIYTAGAGTFIDNLLTLAGGDNLGRRTNSAWPQVSLETVVSWQPEVIVTTYHSGGAEAIPRAVEELRQLVREGRVYYVEADWLNRPGPRCLDALEALVELFHPRTEGQAE